MMNKAIARRECIIGVCVLGIAIIYGTLIPFQASGYTEGNSISGRALPLAIAALLGLLGTLHGYNNWKLFLKLPPDTTEQPSINKNFARRVVLYMLASCAYVAGIEYIGFIVSSLVIIPCYILLSGGRSMKPLVITSLATPLILYVIFTVIMEIYLPDGLLI